MTFDRLTLSVAEAAAALGISRPTMYHLLNRSDFPRVQVGRRVLIPRRELEAWLTQQAHEERGGA